MREEGAEALAHLALADVGVTVAVRAELDVRVVHVEAAEAVEPDALVDLAEGRVDGVRVGHVDARDPEVARVEAEPELRVAVKAVEERGELVDRTADRAAGPGRVLEQEPRRALTGGERLFERRCRVLEAGLETGAEVGADVEDDAVGLDRAGDADRVQQGVARLLPERLVRPSRG